MADKKISELNQATALFDSDDFAVVQDSETKQLNASVLKAYTKDGLSKTDVGLDQVDNTADVDKPISTAVQTALDAKQAVTAKNAANGYAGLDANAKLPTSLLPDSVVTLTGTQTLTNKTFGQVNSLGAVIAAGAGQFGDDVDITGDLTLTGAVNGTAIPVSKTLVVTTDIGASVQPYDVDIPTAAATQAEMEAGTETALRSMSPLRVRQAIIAVTGAASAANDIGVAGAAGFGVGICPGPLPAGVTPVSEGTFSPYSPDYGNYQYTDGSVMVWIPAFFYKWTSTNVIDIQRRSAYADVASANAAGYALHRAFYDGGEVSGFFMDKYLCSNNGGVFSSKRFGIPCDTDGSQSGIAALTGVGTNNYGYIQKAASQRGTNFHSASLFMHKALALLSFAHAQASSNATYCAWYDATYNFPKGCNNDALSDSNDGSLTFLSAGHGTYPNKPKAGSANLFAKTTHNGQACGIADLNGSMWEVAFGLTSDGSNYYALKTSKRLRDLIGTDASSSTSLFGSSGISTNYDSLGSAIGQAQASNSYKAFGSSSQVLSTATSGADWQAAGAGIPIAVGGTNAFGSDGFWDYRPNEMCPLVGAGWSYGSDAGVWALALSLVRASANYHVGGRAALYL